MQNLLEGYRQFRAARWPKERELFAELAKGQAPRYLVISCCDSRADPATIFNARPGELFVLRNVANIVPPCEHGGGYHGTSSAIAFAVLELHVRCIVVMGHAGCGGITAALHHAQTQDVPFLSDWIDLLAPAVERTRGQPDLQTATEREGVKLSLQRLMSFPFVAEKVKAGELILEGTRFGIAEGKLEWLDQSTGAWSDIG